MKLEDMNDKTANWITAIALITVALLVAVGIVILKSQAVDVQIDITNSTPSVSTVKTCLGSTSSTSAAISGCSDIASIVLNAGSTKGVSVVALVTDLNGVDDLDATATGVFFQSGGSASCTADNNDCYRDDAGCYKITPAVDGTNAWFRCDYSLEYFASPAGTFDFDFTVEDIANAQGTSTAYSTDIAELLAGTFPTIDYSTHALGFTSNSSTNEDITHQNNGNVDLDFLVSLAGGDDQVECDVGSLDASAFEWAADLTADPGDGDRDTTLSTSSQALGVEIETRTNDGSAQGPNNPAVSGDDIKYSYWDITIPSSGVGGSCSETLNVSAFAI